jgi:predicted NAD/FAD-binding protein
MKIAIVGAGISGLVVAHLLAAEHDLTVFEAADYAGGHTNTVDVDEDGVRLPIDTGFIVFNDWTYPNFERLLEKLGVQSEPTRMSFGVKDDVTGLEYAATTPNGFFAQRRNLVSPRHYRMILEIVRFRRAALDILARDENVTLGEYLAREGYGRGFIEGFVVPMGAAIWSAPWERLLEFPLTFFVRFFRNHGMLNAYEQPTWRFIRGGSREYVKPLTRSFANRIRLNAPIASIRRHETHVGVTPRGGETERFDHVVLACHSGQALALLSDPTDAEREVLGAIRYQPNEAILHTDHTLLPKRRAAWAAWNYHRLARVDRPVAISYNMNLLQHLPAKRTYLVTLGRAGEIEPSAVIRRIEYEHPLFTREALEAQSQHHRVSGVARTHYAGAYWFNGFHEDGVKSALRVARRLGGKLS